MCVHTCMLYPASIQEVVSLYKTSIVNNRSLHGPINQSCQCTKMYCIALMTKRTTYVCLTHDNLINIMVIVGHRRLNLHEIVDLTNHLIGQNTKGKLADNICMVLHLFFAKEENQTYLWRHATLLQFSLTHNWRC